MIFSIFRFFCILRFQVFKHFYLFRKVLWSRVTFLMWFSFTCKCILMNCSMMKACARCLCSEWYLNGNYLVVFVSIGVILPLSMLKNLGKTLLWVSVCVCDVVFNRDALKWKFLAKAEQNETWCRIPNTCFFLRMFCQCFFFFFVCFANVFFFFFMFCQCLFYFILCFANLVLFLYVLPMFFFIFLCFANVFF